MRHTSCQRQTTQCRTDIRDLSESAMQQRIIAFDDEGGGWAGRLCWTLDVIGHYDWAYLDGGLHAWHAAGLPLAQGLARQRLPNLAR